MNAGIHCCKWCICVCVCFWSFRDWDVMEWMIYQLTLTETCMILCWSTALNVIVLQRGLRKHEMPAVCTWKQTASPDDKATRGNRTFSVTTVRTWKTLMFVGLHLLASVVTKTKGHLSMLPNHKWFSLISVQLAFFIDFNLIKDVCTWFVCPRHGSVVLLSLSLRDCG